MSKVSPEKYVEGVNSIYVEKPDYELGHDGSDGSCDCIGMCRGGLIRAGAKNVTGMRGTNQAARHTIENLQKLKGQDQLLVGDVVLKTRSADDPNMPLPAKYRKGGSDYSEKWGETNFTHIGTVTKTAPFEITHMTSPTAKKDKSTKGWSYFGELPWVDYKAAPEPPPEPEPEPQKAIVTAESGSTVNLRKEPSTSAALVDKIPVGTEIDIIEYGTDWCRVEALGKTGWMMTQFIQMDGEITPGEPEAPDPDGWVQLKVRYEDLAAAYPFIKTVCDQIVEQIGRG